MPSENNRNLISSSNVHPTPKYYQLEEILREIIAASGEGHPIPSESELCRIYSMSRTTVRKAIDDLAREGLLYRVQGKGTFVAPLKVRVLFTQRRVGFYEDMSTRGIQVRTRVLEQEVIEASKRVVDELQLDEGEKIIKLVRIRNIDDDPILISTTFLPYRLFPGLESEDLTSVSLYHVMCDKYGFSIGYGTRWVEAQPCSDDDAVHLQIEPTTPLLVVTDVMYDTEGHPLEYGIARQRGDRTQVEISVLRQ